MSGNMRRSPTSKKAASFSASSALFNVNMAIYTIGFITFRIAEIYFLFATFPAECFTATFAAILIVRWSRGPWYIVAIPTMLAFVYVIDNFMIESLPQIKPNDEMVVVITGANSGIGFETAKTLASGSSVITVVMACRSMKKCNTAADEIVAGGSNESKVIPLHLDLANFESVKLFAKEVEQAVDRKVDVLFNNAGYTPDNVEPSNQYSLDPSITSMHISHHLLAELLLERNENLRVVATSSGTHHFCSFSAFVPENYHSMLGLWTPGCIDEYYLTHGIYSAVNANKYIVAKLANVMHVTEIPKHHPSSTAIAIDLGWVGTSIQPWMKGNLTPTSMGWMRSANIGIYPVLMAILQPSEYFGPRDWAKEGGLLIDSLGKTQNAFTRPWWTGEINKSRMDEIGKKLWDKTTTILKNNAGDL